MSQHHSLLPLDPVRPGRVEPAREGVVGGREGPRVADQLAAGVPRELGQVALEVVQPPALPEDRVDHVGVLVVVVRRRLHGALDKCKNVFRNRNTY